MTWPLEGRLEKRDLWLVAKNLFWLPLKSQTYLVIRLSKFRWPPLNTSLFAKINLTFKTNHFHCFSPICQANSDKVLAQDFGPIPEN